MPHYVKTTSLVLCHTSDASTAVGDVCLPTKKGPDTLTSEFIFVALAERKQTGTDPLTRINKTTSLVLRHTSTVVDDVSLSTKTVPETLTSENYLSHSLKGNRHRVIYTHHNINTTSLVRRHTSDALTPIRDVCLSSKKGREPLTSENSFSYSLRSSSNSSGERFRQLR